MTTFAIRRLGVLWPTWVKQTEMELLAAVQSVIQDTSWLGQKTVDVWGCDGCRRSAFDAGRHDRCNADAGAGEPYR